MECHAAETREIARDPGCPNLPPYAPDSGIRPDDFSLGQGWGQPTGSDCEELGELAIGGCKAGNSEVGSGVGGEEARVERCGVMRVVRVVNIARVADE